MSIPTFKKLIRACGVFALSLLCVHGITFAQDTSWGIDSFDSDITINKDTTMAVTERLEVNFVTDHHGINRDIPIHYTDALGQPYTMGLRVISITDEAGIPYNYELQEEEWPLLRIHIGDADTLLSGKHAYIIRYGVRRTFTLQKGGSVVEIPWNVTGTWGVDMGKVHATFHLPSPADTVCFSGPQGSKASDCSIQKNGNTLQATTTGGMLSTGDQLTVALQFPAAAMELPSTTQYVLWYLQDNFLLLWALGMVIGITVLWWRYGKELPLDTIMPRWEVPEDMTPFLAQLLGRDVITNNDFSASMIFLATRGFMTISAIKNTKHYAFAKTAKSPDELAPAERKLYDGIFGARNEVSTSDLKNKFYTNISPIKEAAAEDVMARKWFYKKPSSVRAIYVLLGVLVAGLGGFLCIGFDQGISFLAILFAGLYWILLGLAMPKKTREGRQRDAELRGLREYILRAETLRLKIKNPPGHTRNEFDRLLPFAMIFGIEADWARQFKDVLSVPPEWATGDTTSFTGNAFLSSLHTFGYTSVGSMVSSPPSTSTSSSFSSSGGSSFGGGGFSGGGFGGGGGGSW